MEYKHWCGNCQIRIYIERHEGVRLNWEDCPYTCEYSTAMRCSAQNGRGVIGGNEEMSMSNSKSPMRDMQKMNKVQHGRLIESVELYDKVEDIKTKALSMCDKSQSWQFGVFWAIRQIEEALTNTPTIIPASEEEMK